MKVPVLALHHSCSFFPNRLLTGVLWLVTVHPDGGWAQEVGGIGQALPPGARLAVGGLLSFLFKH